MADQSSGKSGTRSREKRWLGVFTRSSQRVANVLGIIPADEAGKVKKFRKQELETLDQYYENRQYDKMPEWNASIAADNDYVAVRKRKPLLIYPFPKLLCSRVASKLVGDDTFPRQVVEEDPDTTEFIRLIQKHSKMKARLLEPVRRMLGAGSCFVRFSIVQGQYKIEHYLSKYCYPVFDAVGELESVRIQYCYEDEEDRDSKGDPKRKWYRLDLTKTVDVLYDSPEFNANASPTFNPVAQVEHNLGFVQGEWFRTSIEKHNVDGYSLFGDIMGFCDELSYNLSQSSQSIMYNQDPQMVINNMSEDEIDALIKSSMKAWNLGKEGKAEFLESDLGAVKVASEYRKDIRLGIQDLARVILLDPEKVVSHAQSGKAMEVLHGPMVELIKELRPEVEDRIANLTLKMMAATLQMSSEGMLLAIQPPPGYRPKSLLITTNWAPVFPMTVNDLKEKLSVATSATAANIASREWATRWLAKDLGVENVEEELAKIAAQPVLNPFGGF